MKLASSVTDPSPDTASADTSESMNQPKVSFRTPAARVSWGVVEVIVALIGVQIGVLTPATYTIVVLSPS
jgi:hypothetical protein